VDFVFLPRGVVVEIFDILCPLATSLGDDLDLMVQGRMMTSTHAASPFEGIILKMVTSLVLS
jgi:hypothetical protein